MMLRYRILDFNPKYFISNKGFVVSLVGNFHILRPRYDKNGYIHYYIRDLNINKRKDYKGHRLVAEAFLDKPSDLDLINHIDGNKANNHVENLEWCNYSQNMIHAHTTGLITPKYRECTINGITYKSISHAAKELGVSRKTIYNILKM